MRRVTKYMIICLIVGVFSSCKKVIQIPPPIGNVLAPQVFSTDAEATSASVGMYYKMINTINSFSSSGISINAGMSADELIPFNQNSTDPSYQFQHNSLQPSNGTIGTSLWSNIYSVIYIANDIIEGLSNFNNVHDSVKYELIGEAEFVRAFCNFYLVNLFGDVPLVNSTNYRKVSLLGRAAKEDIYQFIITDLMDAKSKLAPDYSVASNQRIIPNRYAAMALLARVYLYRSDWANAVKYSDSVISNTTLYKIVSDPTLVFLANSKEAIWQLQQSNTISPSFNVTSEGFKFIPKVLNSTLYSPYAYFTPSFLNAFETGDLRRTSWINATTVRNVKYYFPYKYRLGPANASANGAYNEYYMVQRLGELYLIRAEANAHLGNSSAIVDMNIIRARANLPPYAGPNNRDSILVAIQHERQVELFVEWGHRWLDLKRTESAINVLSSEKGFTVDPNSLLYPIPMNELMVAPNLIQNPGYN